MLIRSWKLSCNTLIYYTCVNKDIIQYALFFVRSGRFMIFHIEGSSIVCVRQNLANFWVLFIYFLIKNDLKQILPIYRKKWDLKWGSSTRKAQKHSMKKQNSVRKAKNRQ